MQSYRRAYPPRQHFSLPRDLTIDLWPFDLRVSACRAIYAMHWRSTGFVVDSSSSFPFRARTHTDTQSHRRHWSPYPRIDFLAR